MLIMKVFLLAFIGGVIGWITNFVAIKLMFKPYEPITIPLLNWTIQGLIPKRRKEIAKSIANTIEKELFSANELMENALTEHNQEKIFEILKAKIITAVKEKLPPMLSMFSPVINNIVDNMIEKEGKTILKEVLKQGIDVLSNDDMVSKMVEEKINSFDLKRIEDIILDIAREELKHIEVLGGILGFIIGLIQGIIVLGLM